MWELFSFNLPNHLREALEGAMRDWIHVKGVDPDRHFDAGSKTFFTSTRRNSALLRDILCVPEVRDFYSSRLEDPVVQHAYPLIKAPGGPATTFHQDRVFWNTFDHPPSMFTLWFAISDVSPANGCLRMASSMSELGEHRGVGGTFELDRQPDQSQDVPMRAGQIVFFDSFQPHGAHTNSTSDYRLAIKIALGERASMLHCFTKICDLGSRRHIYKLAAQRAANRVARIVNVVTRSA